MVKRDDRSSPVFDDDTSKHEVASEPALDNPTVIDEPLGQEVAIRLRELRKEMARKQSALVEPEKTAYTPQPRFEEDDVPRLYEDDDHPTMWEMKSAGPSIVSLDRETVEAEAYRYPESRLGSAVPVNTHEEPEHTERSLILEEPEKPPPIEEMAECTRMEPIPMELFFDWREPAVPESSRPAVPAKIRARSIEKEQPIEEPSDSVEQTMLDVAAQMGMAPEAVASVVVQDEDTFDEVKEAVRDAARSVEEPQPTKLPLPPVEPELELQLFDEPRAKRPREGMGSQDIRRYASAAGTLSRLIPLVLGVFVIVATLYAMVSIFHGMTTKTDEHIELRFLAMLNGRSSEIVLKEGSRTARIYIETNPPELLVLHNRAILGKTPITIDLPIELGEEIGVELSSPYYETWVAQVKRDTDEYRIHAELRQK